MAVVKADAYGLGANQVVAAIADVVDRFCVFSLYEAQAIDLAMRNGKECLIIGPPASLNASDYLEIGARPAVSNPDQATSLKAAAPVLCVDTGQQRFACPRDRVEQTVRAGDCREAFTHAIQLAQAELLRETAGGLVATLHAAGSSLLNEPQARLNGVRPGIALYRGAVRVSTSLAETHTSAGPAGYSGFVVPHHGVILAGYSNGLHVGPCLVNGKASRILEVGMQSAFVETDGSAKPGDEVVLLGNGLSEEHLSKKWNTSPHECLVRMCQVGIREYLALTPPK